MAEKNIKERVQRSYEKYNSYDLRVWSLELLKIKRKGWKVLYFFTGEEIVALSGVILRGGILLVRKKFVNLWFT